MLRTLEPLPVELPRGRGIGRVSGGRTVSADPLQVQLVDQPLIEEIQLLTDLIVAATAVSGPLDQRAIDAALRLGSVAR